MNYKGKNGKAPLENAEEWKHYNKNGVTGLRETSTMPGSAGSSWYYLRYIDPKNDKELANKELLKHWMPVDLYIGGPEHAVGHLIYSRIWNRYLYNKGIAPTKEPFQKLVHQGMILGENGIKMGKRFPKYVINPSDIVREYGADTLRLYEMFMGPLEASKPWNPNGVDGARKFIERVYRLVCQDEYVAKQVSIDDGVLAKAYNKMVKKVSEDYESLNFNTAISAMMVFVNEAYKAEKLYVPYLEGLVKLISPVCPHLGEELWEILGHKNTIAFESWPTFDASKLVDDTVKYPVSVNGKLRDTIEASVDASKEDLEAMALASERVKKFTDGHTIVKMIVVPKKIINIVIK